MQAKLRAAATCIVVAIRLESNGLSGMLSYEAPSGSEFAFDSSGDDGLCVLSNLEVLSVPGNALTGRLPRAPIVPTQRKASGDENGRDQSSQPGTSMQMAVSRDEPAACLPRLRVLNIAYNAISGALPAWLLAGEALTSLDVSHNLLAYPSEELVSLAYRNGRVVACSGVPPMSCRAFGDEWQLKADAPNECVQCTMEKPWPLVTHVAVLSAFFLFGGTYAVMMILRPNNLKHLFSTIGILIAHLQTLTIVGNLRLAWPDSAHVVSLHPQPWSPSLRSIICSPPTGSLLPCGFVPTLAQVMSYMVINGLQLEAVRPECVFEGGESEIPWFFIFGFAKVAIPLSLLLSLSITRWTLKLVFHKRLRNALESQGDDTSMQRADMLEARLDKLELLETVVFGLILVTSWQSIWDLWDARNTGSDELSSMLALAGAALGLTLFVVQVLFVTRYFINYRSMIAAEKAGAAFQAHKKNLHSSRNSARLQYRLSYTTKRFASHAAHW